MTHGRPTIGIGVLLLRRAQPPVGPPEEPREDGPKVQDLVVAQTVEPGRYLFKIPLVAGLEERCRSRLRLKVPRAPVGGVDSFDEKSFADERIGQLADVLLAHAESKGEFPLAERCGRGEAYRKEGRLLGRDAALSIAPIHGRAEVARDGEHQAERGDPCAGRRCRPLEVGRDDVCYVRLHR